MEDKPFPAADEVDFDTLPSGSYDWANFVFAYSRGRWNPHAIPQPPGKSTLHPGVDVKITRIGNDQAIRALVSTEIQPRRPSLEYMVPAEGGDLVLLESVKDDITIPPLHSAKNGQSPKTGSPSKTLPPPSSKFPSEVHLPERSGTLPNPVAHCQRADQTLELLNAIEATASSTSAVPQSSSQLDHEQVAELSHKWDESGKGSATETAALPKRGLHSRNNSNPIQLDPSVWSKKLDTQIADAALGKKSGEASSKRLFESLHPKSDEQSQATHVSSGDINLASPLALPGQGGRHEPSLEKEKVESLTVAKRSPAQSHKEVRPGPTPVQPSQADGDAPYTWQSAPDSLPSFAQAMARQASEATTSDASSLFLSDHPAEHDTVAGLRRAARRTSMERAGKPDSIRGQVPHSASFPGNSPRSSPSHHDRKHTGAAHISGSSSPPTTIPSTDSANVVGVAHFEHGVAKGETRIDFRAGQQSNPNSVSSCPPVRGESLKSSFEKFDSLSSQKRPTMKASHSSGAYLAAGRRVEEFYRDHGYLPSVIPPNEEKRLHALTRYGPPKIAGDANFERIAHLVKLVFNSKLVLITLVGEKEQIFQTEMGGGGEVTVSSLQAMAGSRNCSFCSHAILQDGDEPIIILDTAKDWRFAGNPLVQGSPDIRFYAGCPLRTADGQNIGSLCLIDDRPREEFGPRKRHTLKEFARVVMREMELLRDKIQLTLRDRMQKSIEQFTRNCLEMESEEEAADTPSSSPSAAGIHRVYDDAAKSMQEALQISGAVIFDLSHFELIDNYDSNVESSVPTAMDHSPSGTTSKIFFSDPHQRTRNLEGAGFAAFDGTSGVGETFNTPLASPDDEVVRGKFVPPMAVLGSSETEPIPAQRSQHVPLAHHVKVAEFLRSHRFGHFFPFVPQPFRSLLPSVATSVLVVPIFGLNKQPFALLCAYSTSTEEGPNLEELQGTGLQYIRAIGMIILSAVLKKDIMLADKAKSHFISNISHELRTPLHGILAAAELLAETKLNATQGSYLETVEACGKSLLELVNHVLDFTKLSGNSRQGSKQAHTKTKCDMVKLIQEVCESSWIGQMAKQLESAQSGIGSVYAPPPGAEPSAMDNVRAKTRHAQSDKVETVIDISMRRTGWLVNCDTGGIRRVLMNLIGNSLKFTSEGFVHVSLRELQSSDTHIVVELGVTDTGRGISRTFLEEQLFHPFTQENPLGTGTGLGLSIVNSIVQSPALNGKIDVWSTEGQGTDIRVTCELELCDENDTEGPIYKPATDVNQSRSVSLLGFTESRGNEDLCCALVSYFRDWWKFRIIKPETDDLGDLVMINDNLELLHEIHQRSKGSLPPVIFLTSGRGDSDIAAACEKYHASGGIARILFKPAGPSKIESVVDFCIQCLDRNLAGDPPASEETKPSTPLPSPSESPAPRPEMEGGDSYFVPKSGKRPELSILGPGQDTGSFDTTIGDLTPRPERTPLMVERQHTQSYHMSPGPPSQSNSLIRRHSTEEKVTRSRSEGGDERSKPPSRPLLPARSITYHEPRLHKHVLMSPIGAAGTLRREGETESYFDHGSRPPSPSTPGSTVALEGGDGAVLKSALSSSRSIHKKRLQILSVEDNAINRKVIAAFLAKMDVDFVEARDGEEGVRKFEAHPPNHFDVILMDLSMPVLDGIGATAAIRRIEAERQARGDARDNSTSRGGLDNNWTPKASRDGNNKARATSKPHATRAKIFALTGRSTDEDKRKAFQTGADGYIVKPLSFKVLSTLLRLLTNG
ncbi:hypothetical protein IE53DRAFT_320841 [Violaceomyces palustris]|uniref:Uncharacterized protein n=1 Tax=Violaceomyces palustris TaxID=1673888 RepID=A0ACD0NPE8_9BASI|nr:hypothetical protein IE53DRAFT_320841 [Violaceomyces palustris]